MSMAGIWELRLERIFGIFIRDRSITNSCMGMASFILLMGLGIRAFFNMICHMHKAPFIWPNQSKLFMGFGKRGYLFNKFEIYHNIKLVLLILLKCIKITYYNN
jgi:hypothetical protein